MFDVISIVEYLPAARGSCRGAKGTYGFMEVIYNAPWYSRQFADEQEHDEDLLLRSTPKRVSMYSPVLLGMKIIFWKIYTKSETLWLMAGRVVKIPSCDVSCLDDEERANTDSVRSRGE